MTHTAEIISVGTELLLGNIANTDAQDISQMLSELGINVYFHTVVGDNPERLKSAVAVAKSRADIIITTGGLGPTCDDLTKQTLAEAFGKELKFDEREAQEIRDYFATRLHNSHMTDNNYRQAMLPEGCTVFHNDRGTAPGCAFESDGVHVLMLPGPPKECVPMFRACAMPYLRRLSELEIVSHNIHIFGMGESAVEDKLRDIMERSENPTLAPYAKSGEVRLRVTARARDDAEAEEMMAPVIDEVRRVIGECVYGIDTDSLENTVLGLLRENHVTLAAAESCTGGLVSKRITDLPGSSEVYLGGAVTYAPESKTALLGVPADMIEHDGVVSPSVSQAMAQGVRNRFDAGLGIGITGIAGPGSDSEGTPVGTVYVSLATPRRTYTRHLHLGQGRDRVRISAANHALDMVRRYLTGIEVENWEK